jgi:hypothetical protein
MASLCGGCMSARLGCWRWRVSRWIRGCEGRFVVLIVPNSNPAPKGAPGVSAFGTAEAVP